jgi:phosphohistidine phosphatase
MDLILWRHAEAEEGSESLPDLKRRLTARGEKQARQMAKWLEPRLPKRVRTLVSPAERTLQTAHALDLPFEIEPNIGTQARPTDLLDLANQFSNDATVILVGHQPALGQFAALLLTGEAADWSVKKGAIWWFNRRVRNGRIQTVLRAVLAAEMA